MLPQPVALRLVGDLVNAPAIALARLVPHQISAVERPVKEFAYRRGRPAARPASLRSRARSAFGVEQFRDPGVAGAAGAEFEHPADNGGFGLVDAPLDVRARTGR